MINGHSIRFRRISAYKLRDEQIIVCSTRPNGIKPFHKMISIHICIEHSNYECFLKQTIIPKH